MLTIPSALWTELLSQSFRPVEVYEIDPIDRLGATELLGNGDFETWSGGPLTPNGWSVFPNSATITKETALMRTGTAAAKFTYVSTTLNSSVQRYDLAFTPGTWVHVEAWFRSSVIRSNCIGIRIVNLTTVRELKTDMTWGAGNTGLFAIIATPAAVGVYQRMAFWFQVEATAGAANAYAISIETIGTAGWIAGDALYVDSASVLGCYERPTLYYSSQDVTWNSSAYTGLAVERRSVKKQMEFRVPDCTVTFSNVSNLLRAYLDPVDMLTGSRLTVRMLCKDSSNVTLPDSLVLFKGRVEPPSAITETQFTLSVVGIIDGMGVETPAWRMSLTCGWQFANGGAFDGGGHCAYQQSTTTSGTVTNSTTIPLTSASTFKNGDSIQIAGAAAVTIVSGGGTGTLVVSSPQTCGSGAGVRYADCPGRSATECTARAMLHRFGGNTGVSITSRIGRQVPDPVKVSTRGTSRGNVQAPSPNTVRDRRPIFLRKADDGGLAGAFDSVPVLYGRRRVRPIVVELVQSQSPVLVIPLWTAFYLLGVGPIASVVRCYTDGMISGEVYDAGNVDKLSGMYVRLGNVGIIDNETIAEYTADPVTILRAQNIDYRSFAGSTYSEKAYALALRGSELLAHPDLTFECKGRTIQLYDAAGALSGSIVYSENPIWQCVDWTTKDYGLGNDVLDVDFSVTKVEADYAGTLITSTEASTTVTANQGSASTTCDVGNTEGFVNGRRVDVNGVANTVDYVASPTRMFLGTAVTQSIGQTVVQRPYRFESHLDITQTDSGTRWLTALLASCRGYVTDDAGKIQFRIERDHVKERLTDGGFEVWSSSTNLTNWTENISSLCTITQETSLIHGGTSAVRLSRVDGGNLWLNATLPTSLEPGRWYRFACYARRVGVVATRAHVSIRNATRSLEYDASTQTWGSITRYAIDSAISGVYTLQEVTFRVDQSFAATDTYVILFLGDAVGTTVIFDDASLRGPYAGDFRETTGTQIMGWKEGSFVWSLDKRDRETNRISVGFLNESAYFGDDEALANDFAHQRLYPVKTINVDAPSVCDRDQAARLAAWLLAKKRTLKIGCGFLGSPAALAIQPGDVILVSHTVPNWIAKEQRVISTEILGLGNDDEHFVQIETEDYLESIYPDTAPAGLKSPTRTAVVITPTVERNSGGVLDLTWVADATVINVANFRIHSSDTAGFNPDATNQIFVTVGSRMVYNCPKQFLEQLRYYRIVAMTDYGALASAEFIVTIYAVDYDATDGTQTENEADGNLIYDGDFQGTEFQDGVTKNGDGWLTNTNIVYTNRLGVSATTPSGSYASGGGSNVAFTSPNNAWDGNNATYAIGSSTYSGTGDNVTSMKVNFAAATRTGRGKVIGKVGVLGNGTVKLFYTIDGGTNWIQFATAISVADTAYYTPRIVSQAMANFSIEARVEARQSLPTNTTVWNMAEASFDEETSGTVISHIADGKLELNADGTNYAEARRRFPGKSPGANGTFLTTTTPNRWEIKAQALGGPVVQQLEIRIEDALSGKFWTVASINAGDITSTWRGFTGLFDPGASPVAGQLDIVVRTKSNNGVRVDQVGIFGQRVIKRFQVSVEDQQLGRYPDRRLGDAIGWPKGKLTAGTYRKVNIA